MLKRILFITICLCLSQKTDNNSYLHYFNNINKAELAIADSQYSESLSIYKKLLAVYPHSFYKDIHNATLCAIKTRQYKYAIKLSKELVRHGYELSDFESPAFNELRDKKKYWKQFLNEYPELRKNYTKTLNEPLRDSYNLLYTIDQDAASLKNEIRKQDSIFYNLAVSVSNLIKRDNFPQWMINKDTMNAKLHVMLRHYCGLENRIKNDETMQMDSLYIRMQNNDIRLLVTQALDDGWISPDRYVNIITYWDNSNLYGETAIQIDFEKERITPFLKVPLGKEKEINQLRESIGLPHVSELTQDVIKAYWYGDYPFQKIKEAWLACDTCLNLLSYMRISSNLELEVRNNYKENYFIIPDFYQNSSRYYKGIKEYQINLKNAK